jgi:hypothetical protein
VTEVSKGDKALFTEPIESFSLYAKADLETTPTGSDGKYTKFSIFALFLIVHR